MSISIRQCRKDELDDLHKISYETYDDTFRPMNSSETMDKYLEEAFNREKLFKELDSNASRFYFLFANDELAGYLKINEAPGQSDINDVKSLEIERIYIRKEHKGKALGRALMDFAFKHAAEAGKDYVWLGVWEKNFNAIAFYNKMGFSEAGRHSFRMGDELQSDIIMKKVVKFWQHILPNQLDCMIE